MTRMEQTWKRDAWLKSLLRNLAKLSYQHWKLLFTSSCFPVFIAIFFKYSRWRELFIVDYQYFLSSWGIKRNKGLTVSIRFDYLWLKNRCRMSSARRIHCYMGAKIDSKKSTIRDNECTDPSWRLHCSKHNITSLNIKFAGSRRLDILVYQLPTQK